MLFRWHASIEWSKLLTGNNFTIWHLLNRIMKGICNIFQKINSELSARISVRQTNKWVSHLLLFVFIIIMIRELFALNRVCYMLTKCGIVIWTIECNTSQYNNVYSVYPHNMFYIGFVLSLNLILIEEVCETSITFVKVYGKM